MSPRPAPRRHPFYCEENVWHLCHDPVVAGRPLHAVFITNPTRTCAMWHQRAAPHPRGPVVWDYHVVVLAEAPWEVWDVDSTLGLPIAAGEYLERSFRRDAGEAVLPVFRVIEAGVFAEAFASDRAHMRGPDGRYHQPPPPWPPIGRAGAPSNLLRFVDLADPIAGEILTLAELRRRVV